MRKYFRLKTIIYSILLMFFFQYFYYMRDVKILFYINKFAFVLLSFTVVYAYILYIMLRKKYFPYFGTIVGIFLLLVVISTFSSYFNFNQPIFFGITAQIKLAALFFYFLSLFILLKYKMSISDVTTSVVFIGVTTFILYYVFALFFNVSDFVGKNGFILWDPTRGFRFNLPYALGIVTSFYFLRKFNITKKLRYLIFFLPFIFFIIYFAQERMLSFGIIMISLFILFSTLIKNHKFLFIILFFIVSFLLLLAGIMLFNPENLMDSSMGIRVNTIMQAFAFMSDNKLRVLFGAGGLNSFYSISFQDYFNINFWPSDIGWIGILFEFGIIGVIASLYLYYILLKEANKASIQEPILLALKDYVYLSILLSPLIPSLVYDIGLYMTILSLFVYKNHYLNKGIVQ